MSDIRRRADGTLAGGGASLNPAGRRGKRRLVTPSDFRRAIIAISQMPTPLRDAEGNPEPTTRYGWHLFNLATGDPQTRLGSKDFIELVQKAVAAEENAGQVWTPLSGIPAEVWEVYREAVVRKASAPVERDGNGRFTGSGNPRGRPRKIDTTMSRDMAEMMIDTANRMVILEVSGRPERIILFESKVRTLGQASGRTRIAARKWIEKVFAAAATLHRRSQEETRAEVIEAWKQRDGGAGIAPGQMSEQTEDFADREFPFVTKANWKEMVTEAGSVEALMEEAGWKDQAEDGEEG